MIKTSTALTYDSDSRELRLAVTVERNGTQIIERSIPLLLEQEVGDLKIYPERPIVSKRKLSHMYGEVFYEVSGDGDIDGANQVYHDIYNAIDAMGIEVTE